MAASEFDIHTHTIASGHASTATITDMAKAAASRNLKLLGISDHGPATLGGGRPILFSKFKLCAEETARCGNALTAPK